MQSITLKTLALDLVKSALLALALAALTTAVMPRNLTHINPLAGQAAVGAPLV